MVTLFHDGEVDIALVHWQSLARESFNLEPVRRIVFLAYPFVGLLEWSSCANLLDHCLYFMSDFLVIWALIALELVHKKMRSIEG